MQSDVLFIRWYLNGDLEGSVEAPLIVDPGTAFIGIGNNRTGIETGRRGFHGLLDEIRILDEPLEPGMFLMNSGEPVLQAGDADMDLNFDQLDLVQVPIAAKYLSGLAATWGEGDWDGAPSGTPGDPPNGNGKFDQLDIIAALAAGTYLNGPYAALAAGLDDGQLSIESAAMGFNELVDAGMIPGAVTAEPIDVVLVPVPEPSAMALLVLGLVFVAVQGFRVQGFRRT